MVEVTGRLALAQSIWRRLSTPHGRLLDDASYGYDLAGEINDDLSPLQIARISTRIVSECKKDERVRDAKVSAIFDGSTLTVVIVVTDGTGPFRLTLAVSSTLVQLLQVAA